MSNENCHIQLFKIVLQEKSGFLIGEWLTLESLEPLKYLETESVNITSLQIQSDHVKIT